MQQLKIIAIFKIYFSLQTNNKINIKMCYYLKQFLLYIIFNYKYKNNKTNKNDFM